MDKTFTSEYEHFKKLYGSLYDEQLELEQRTKADAEKNLQALLEKERREGLAGSGKLASRFTEYAWGTSRENVKALLSSVAKPSKTTQGLYVKPLKDLLNVFDNKTDELESMLVLVGHSTILNSVLQPHNDFTSLSSVASAICKNVQREADIEAFLRMRGEEGADAARLEKSMDAGIKKRVQASYKIAYAVNRMQKEGFKSPFCWSAQEKVAVGAKIIEVLIAGSGFYEIRQQVVNKTKLSCIGVSEWFYQAWLSNENRLIENTYWYVPTIVPPKPWTGVTDGGYYGATASKVQVVRLQTTAGNTSLKRHLNKLQTVDLSYVFSALNAMQETPFAINKDILDVAQEIYDTGGGLGGVPQTEPLPQLPRLPEIITLYGTPEDVLKEHKKKGVTRARMEERRKSKALRAYNVLRTAERFSVYERIYFPWNMDYRGRCYPIPTALTPQGDDLQKALLLFADPSPLTSDEDAKWMKIHGANTAGQDKKTLEERIAWVDANEKDILASAQDPLGHTWWSKHDYPMEFLAFCFEWTKALAYKVEHGTFVGFKTGLPVSFDGTCSGLQHFSGLLRDEIGGQAVNLVPMDSVQDIYSIVADKVNTVLLQDSLTGTADGYKTNKKGDVELDADGKPRVQYGSKTLAQNWIVFNRQKFNQDGITRKVCKRSVMTLAYGSRHYGFKENLLTDIITPYVLEHPEDNPFISPNQAATYMATLIWEAVGQTVVKSVEGMAWLQAVAGLVSKDNHLVTWSTPNGLPVQQTYLVMIEDVVNLRFNKARVRFYTRYESETADPQRQRNGVAPNFIHSMDAAHLQRVVKSEFEKGNKNFLMIHDSFGTDVAHAGQLFKTIREEFVKLYDGQNWLEEFLKQVAYAIKDEDMDKIPPIPSFGELDLAKVIDSKYCFA